MKVTIFYLISKFYFTIKTRRVKDILQKSSYELQYVQKQLKTEVMLMFKKGLSKYKYKSQNLK